MSKKNNGGPAFPVDRDLPNMLEGMSLRDYFAAKALQGILANIWGATRASNFEISEACYEIADAMLKARE